MATFTTTTTPEDVMATFEAHLENMQRVPPGTVGYAESRYSRLIEAITVAWFARMAFVEQYWHTDTRAMLVEWLSPAQCAPFFAGDSAFIDSFRLGLQKRARRHAQYANVDNSTVRFEDIGPLGPQYRDIDRGIMETDPTEVTLVTTKLFEPTAPAEGRSERITALAQLKVMAAVARADGTIDDREVGLLQLFCEQNALTNDDLNSVLAGSLILRKQELPQRWLERHELLLKALEIARADQTVGTCEVSLLRRVATALGVPQDQLETLIRASMPVSASSDHPVIPTNEDAMQRQPAISLPRPVNPGADDLLETEITTQISMLAECPCLVSVLASPHWGWMHLRDERLLALSKRDRPGSSKNLAKVKLLGIIRKAGAKLVHCEFQLLLRDDGTTWRADFGEPSSVLRIDVKLPGNNWVRGVGVGCVMKDAEYIVWDWDG